MTYPVLGETIVGGVTTGHNAAHEAINARFNASFYVNEPASGSASGKDKTAVSEAVAAALACGRPAALIVFAGGTYDVGDLAIVLPQYGSGVQLTFYAPFLTTLKFSVDTGAGQFAVKGAGTESDLYFHTFDGVGLQGPGASGARPGSLGSPPTNVLGGGDTEMSGIWCGSRMRLLNGGCSGFRAGVQIAGNHITLRSWNCPDNLDAIYWAQAYGLSGDVLFDNCALDGNLRSPHCISPTSIATFKMTKGHLGFSPYDFYCEPGRTGASALAMGGIILDGTSSEFTGNAFIHDPDQFARIYGFLCLQVGAWSISTTTYRDASAPVGPWIKVDELSDTKFIGGMPLAGDGNALFDLTGTLRMESDTWRASYASAVAAGQPWILTTAAPSVRLTDWLDDSEARVAKANQTVSAGQVLEHSGQASFAVRPFGHFGAGIRGIYAGVALNAATSGSRTGVVCVLAGAQVPVQIDTVAADSYAVVADGTVVGKAKGIKYDGTNTSTLGRPLIGEAYFGPLVASTTSDVHLIR